MIFSILTASLKPSKNGRPKFARGFGLALAIQLVFSGFACFSGFAYSQETDVKTLTEQKREEIFTEYFNNWYQVEMIIFERVEETAFVAESWPKNITLSYPLTPQFLTPEEPLSAPNESLINADTQQEVKTKPVDNSELLNQLKTLAQNDPLNKKILAAIEKAEIDRLTPREKPYKFLDASLHSMNSEASRIERDRAMRVLFHQTWRQPMAAQKVAPALIVTGGDPFADNFELEGSIKLFVSRYLHIHTNLWLAQFEANVGQEEAHWPIIPLRPQAPKPTPLPSPLDDLAEITGEVSEEATAQTTGQGEQTNSITSAQGSANFDNTNFDSAALDTPITGEDQTRWDISFDDLPANSSQSYSETLASDLLGDYNQLATNPYVVKHLVTLRQKRRMRSGELHYIDHPRMGILLRIDKYKPSFENSSTP